MSFMRGKDVKVFITTENESASVLITDSTASAATGTEAIGPNAVTSTQKGVGHLGSVTGDITASDSAASRIMNVEAIDPVWRWEDDPVTVFGQTRPLDNPVRQRWEVTITRRAEDTMFGVLFQGARFGVTSSDTFDDAELFDGLYTMPNDTGYRIYIWDGSTFYVGCHGTPTPDGYKETLTPTGITAQSITFAGGLWYAAVPSGSSILTATADISQ